MELFGIRDKPTSIASIAVAMADKHANRALLPDKSGERPIGVAHLSLHPSAASIKPPKIHSATDNTPAIISAV